MSERAKAALAGLDAWADEHGDVLRLVWQAFDRDDEWPEAATLTRQYFKQQPRRDYTTIARRMPASLGRLDLGPNNVHRIVLTPRALSYVPEAQPVLKALFSLIRVAIDRYENMPGEPVIAASEIPALLGIHAAMAQQVEQVATLDSWALRPAGGSPGSGDFHLLVNENAALVIADAKSFEEFLQLELEAWYPDPEPAQQIAPVVVRAPDPKAVMVVHGRDLAARNDLFNLLRAMNLKPIEWDQAVRATESGTPYTGDAVEAAFQIAQAAVVLCTPDETVLLRGDLRNPDEPSEAQAAWQPRPNVFFEGGIAFTTHPKRTIVLELGTVRMASDLLGRNTIRLGPGATWRQSFVERLRTAGCAVDTSGSDWLTTGAFTIPNLVLEPALKPAGGQEIADHLPITGDLADKQW